MLGWAAQRAMASRAGMGLLCQTRSMSMRRVRGFRSRKNKPQGERIKGRYSRREAAELLGDSKSSTEWLQRSLTDPFVMEARRKGLRSRSYFKIEELDRRFNLLKTGDVVIDLGAFPGGWCQYFVSKVYDGDEEDILLLGDDEDPLVVAVDLESIEYLPGVISVDETDVLETAQWPKIMNAVPIGRRPSLVSSDMAAKACGQNHVDHDRIIELASSALLFAVENLEPGGHFVTKLLHGKHDKEFRTLVSNYFETVQDCRPKATHKESSEFYIIGLNRHE